MKTMNNEMKKIYSAPEMTVIQLEPEGCLLVASCEKPGSNCYGNGFGYNDGVSDVEHA
jgi:hypothetical protein